MSKRSRHSSVLEMARSLSEDESFLTAFEERLQRRQLVKALAVLRAKQGITQAEVAKSLHCTQAKVSKLESGDDADARFGDLLAYAEAVGYQMRISLVPKKQPDGPTLLLEAPQHENGCEKERRPRRRRLEGKTPVRSPQ